MLLSAEAYTKVSETTEHGYPIREHIRRLIDGDIIWAPAIDGAFVLTTRGGGFDLQLATDVSIGYLTHDAETVQLYPEETLTFLCYTAGGVGRAQPLARAHQVELCEDDTAPDAEANPWSVPEHVASVSINAPVAGNSNCDTHCINSTQVV